MTAHRYLWPRVAAALILAAGLQLVWSVVFMYTVAVVYSLRQDREQRYETLGVALDGTPMIGTNSSSMHVDWTYRTLDGKPLPEQTNDGLSGAQFPEPMNWIESPLNWSYRLRNAVWDQQRPPTIWYAVRDSESDGHAYLVGYDEKSKLIVGYIGRNGFRAALPPEDEWFNVGRREMTVSGGGAMLTFSLGPRLVGAPMIYDLFIIDGNALYDIELRARTARKVFESPGLLTLSSLVERLGEADETSPETPADADTVAADAQAGFDLTKIKLRQRIAVRTGDRIVILNPSTSASREYVLPESLRDKSFQAFSVPDGQLLIVETRDIYDRHLMWLATDGTIEREESVTLAGYRDSMGESQVIPVLAAPVPLGWLIGIFAPTAFSLTEVEATYGGAVAKRLSEGWPMLVAVLVIGSALAGWTYYLHRKYRRRSPGVWCTFVFLLGGPAFLAYWFEHRRPKLDACRECSQIVPRDRDACAACNAPFPAAQPVGTEIFA